MFSAVSPRGSKRPAFTLVEILVTLVIMGIAAAVVVPQMMATGQMGIQAAARMVIGDLLVAQNDAVAAQRSRRVVFEPELNRYRITDSAGINIRQNWKAHGGHGAEYIVDFTLDTRFKGVRIESAAFGEGTTVEFTDLGAPIQGGEVVLSTAGHRYRVRVSDLTGRVTVERLGAAEPAGEPEPEP